MPREIMITIALNATNERGERQSFSVTKSIEVNSLTDALTQIAALARPSTKLIMGDEQ